MNAKQLLKLLALFAIFVALSYVALDATSGALVVFLEEFLAPFIVIGPACVALSVALYNYVDNTTKDLSDVRTEVDRRKLSNVLDRLIALKHEVLLNGGLILFLFVLERSIKGVSSYLVTQLPGHQHEAATAAAFSVRTAFFLVALIAGAIQLKGFLLAAGFRETIVRSRK